jgi:Cys-tRNA synthase (O-phospho-L-seryl-tRNA:Cys-tRNA synthase)
LYCQSGEKYGLSLEFVLTEWGEIWTVVRICTDRVGRNIGQPEVNSDVTSGSGNDSKVKTAGGREASKAVIVVNTHTNTLTHSLSLSHTHTHTLTH